MPLIEPSTETLGLSITKRIGRWVKGCFRDVRSASSLRRNDTSPDVPRSAGSINSPEGRTASTLNISSRQNGVAASADTGASSPSTSLRSAPPGNCTPMTSAPNDLSPTANTLIANEAEPNPTTTFSTQTGYSNDTGGNNAEGSQSQGNVSSEGQLTGECEDLPTKLLDMLVLKIIPVVYWFTKNSDKWANFTQRKAEPAFVLPDKVAKGRHTCVRKAGTLGRLVLNCEIQDIPGITLPRATKVTVKIREKGNIAQELQFEQDTQSDPLKIVVRLSEDVFGCDVMETPCPRSGTMEEKCVMMVFKVHFVIGKDYRREVEIPIYCKITSGSPLQSFMVMLYNLKIMAPQVVRTASRATSNMTNSVVTTPVRAFRAMTRRNGSEHT